MFFKVLFLLATLALISADNHDEQNIDARIIGGEEVQKNDARYLAQIFEIIRIKGENRVQFVGTAAFLSGRTVITSASLIEKGKKYMVFWGSNTLIVSPHRQIEVINVLKPPKCDVERRVNNIALLILKESITDCKACRDVEFLEVQVLPIEDNANLQTVGFGWTKKPCFRGQKSSNVLRKTDMILKSGKYCKKITDNASKKGRLLCARPANYVSTVCSGDEGAPLVDMTMKRIVGVMNYGDEYCEPGATVVYTSVINYAMWINKNMVY